MKQLNKLLALLLALSMALSLVACGKTKAPAPDTADGSADEIDSSMGEIMEADEPTVPLQIGTSKLFMQIPESYDKGEMSAEDIADGQIAYFHSPTNPVDFDIYQFPKSGESTADLLEYAKAEAAEYGSEVTEEEGNVFIDEYVIYTYDAEEEYEGKTYKTQTCIFEEGDDFFEVVFWLDGDEDEAVMTVYNMICNIYVADEEYEGLLPVGEAGIYMTAPGYFMSETDDAEDLYGYYKSYGSDVDFDIYQWDAEGAKLEDYAKEEAEGKELKVETVNGVEIYSYMDVEEDNGEKFDTKTCIMKSMGQFVEIVFWCDGENAAAEVEKLISTINTDWTGDIRLAYSTMTIYAPGFYNGPVDDTEDLVEYYKSDDTTLDFDVYQWNREDGQSLDDYAKEEAADKEVTMQEYNGVQVYSYMDKEEADGKEYDTRTCIMKDGGSFVEIVFWLDGDAAADEAETILGTLSSTRSDEINLGTSMHVTAPGYYDGEIADDEDFSLMGYWKSDESSMDFDVYEWFETEYENGAEYTKAAAGDKEVTTSTINGIEVYSYMDKDTSDGKEYDTMVCVIEDDMELVKIVFWLDGDNAKAEAETILNTLTR